MKNNGGPAFPTGRKTAWVQGAESSRMQQVEIEGSKGMSLRAYFAGRAMMGITSHGNHPNGTTQDKINWTVETAVKLADALIAELEKSE